MMKLLCLILFPFLALAVVPRDAYQSCVNASNRLESPADRDAEKIRCFNAYPTKAYIERCGALARVLEHTNASDSLLLSCVSENITRLKASECIGLSKKLYYSENRDRALWICIENKRMKKSQCKEATEEITYPSTKAVAVSYCET